MNTTKICSDKALDHALVQCLRLFAKHGRKVRNQELPVNECPSDKVMIKEEYKDPCDKEDNQK